MGEWESGSVRDGPVAMVASVAVSVTTRVVLSPVAWDLEIGTRSIRLWSAASTDPTAQCRCR